MRVPELVAAVNQPAQSKLDSLTAEMLRAIEEGLPEVTRGKDTTILWLLDTVSYYKAQLVAAETQHEQAMAVLGTVVPIIEVLAGQIRVKPYKELSPAFQEQIAAAADTCRSALAVLAAGRQEAEEQGA